jgi:hypothetical protein
MVGSLADDGVDAAGGVAVLWEGGASSAVDEVACSGRRSPTSDEVDPLDPSASFASASPQQQFNALKNDFENMALGPY